MACEYCKDDGIMLLDHGELCMLMDGDSIKVIACYEDEEIFDGMRCEINYCPMCGKKLGDTNE